MKKRKITIKDIARDCGIGLGTVSRVINSQPGVKDEIRRKVLQYIEDTGWRNNNLRNRLSLADPGETVVIIASTSTLERKYDQDLLRIVLEQMISSGFTPLTLFGQSRENLERCLAMTPYAVIVYGISSFHKEPVNKLLEAGIRTVSLGECDDFAGPLIFPNHRKAAAKATKLLLKAGHERIGFFGGMGIMNKLKSLEYVSIRRIREMLYGIHSANSSHFDPELDVVSDCFSDLSIMERILKQRTHTAWICSDEKMCRQFLRCANSLGIKIPGDLSLVGFTGDLPFYSFDLDISRFIPDNTASTDKIKEILQSKPFIKATEFLCDYKYHSGSTITKSM